MTWRDIWQSTVTNLRVLLGFSPQPTRSSPPRPSSARPTPAPIVKRTPMPLTGPLNSPDRIEPVDHPPKLTSQIAPQTIDLAATRQLPSPSAPLRRKPNIAHVDVALDDVAFAALQRQRAEIVPASAAPTATPAPEIAWTRQGIAQIEQPVMDVPVNGGGFDADDPADGSNGYHRNGGDNGDGPDDEADNETENEEGVALTTLLESLLFVAAEPVEPRQLAQTLAQPLEIIELGLAELADYYQRSLRGLRIQRFNDKVQLVTAPDAAPFIEAFLNLDNSTRLSSPALETLAVIAYRQPVTRAQIEAVRGVDCAGVLRSLVQRGLVVEMGRQEGIGRPILYGVTELFMQHFGLMEMAELPPLEETEADRLWAATVVDEQEAGGLPKSSPQIPR